MSQTAKDKLKACRVKLLIQQPFFGTIVIQSNFIEDNTSRNPTMATDGRNIYYNTKFVESLTSQELFGVLAHEILHICNQHHLRRYSRSPERFNVAADYALNPLLIESGFTLPKGCLLDDKWKNMSTEAIYEKLPEDIMEKLFGKNQSEDGSCQEKPGEGPMMPGGVMDAPSGPGDPTYAEAEQFTKELLAQAAAAARMSGKIPAGLEKMVGELLKPVVNWKSELAQFLTDSSKSDYAFHRPSPRYLASGLYLPSLFEITTGEFVMVRDTSGSIGQKEADRMTSEALGIIEVGGQSLLVLDVDTRVAGVVELEPGDDPQIPLKGGGGTSFAPSVHYLEEHEIVPKALIYMTDGYCDDFAPEPEYPFLWCIIGGNNSFKPPYGEVLTIDSLDN